MRRAARVDDNHLAIVRALRSVGASVYSLAGVGGGVPDLLVGRHGRTYLLEVKDGAKPPSGRALTHAEARFLATWVGGPAVVVESIVAALKAVGVPTPDGVRFQ